MPGVTREQIDRAKQWDLLSYLQQHEPGELKKVPGSSKEYRTVTHDSLVISNGKWNWTTRGFGGKTALDYLIKVQGMEFVEAVRTLCGDSAPVHSPPVKRQAEPEQPRAFILPEANRCATAAVSYLQRRGIDSEIISRCMKAGIFYESKNYHNCVFVGKDKDGKARFACMRGTMGDFKADAPVKRPNGDGYIHPLSGLLYCKDCGTKMHIRTIRKSGGNQYITYCSEYAKGKARHPKCHSPHRIDVDIVMQNIAEVLRKIAQYSLVSLSRKNRHQKASKNRMNRRNTLIYAAVV